MVGPFMQGIVLMGIIYWYSKGMLTMINDYYRSQFQHQLKPDPNENARELKFDIEHIENLMKYDILADNVAEEQTTEASKQELQLSHQRSSDVCNAVVGIWHYQQLLQTAVEIKGSKLMCKLRESRYDGVVRNDL